MTTPTDAQRAQALLPASLAALRPTIAKLLHADVATRDEGFQALGATLDGRTFTRAEALAIVRLASEVAFPPLGLKWNDPVHDLLFPFVAHPQAALVAPLRAAYPRLPERAKCAALAALGAIATRAAAEAFVACVREHGWPASVYSRVFTELAKLQPFADVLFPELVLRAGPQIGQVTNLLVGAVTSGALDPRRVDLAPIAPVALAALRALLAKATKMQRPGVRWRSGERYHEVRTTTGAWLDIAGHLKLPALGPLLVQATRLRDPKLVGFAALSLVRRKRPVAAAVFERVAADPETRPMLYAYLDSLGALAKFPARWRTWEAFAAAEMVTWLMYPAELGHVPEKIELMKKLEEGAQTLYVWKFLDGKTWRAGVSGPYVLKGTPKPLRGASTFSQFELAAAKTPEAHALAVLETLAAWTKAHAKDSKPARTKANR